MFSSIKANLNQKTTNPFLGTFVIIWIIRNWEFVYSIFNFDPDCELVERLAIIQTYFIKYGFLEILITVGYSVLVLVATYVMINLSRLIINFFEKKITPYIYKITDPNSIVLKEVHDQAIEKITKLDEKYQAERRLKADVQDEYDLLEKKYNEMLSRSSTLTNSDDSSKDPTPRQSNADKMITKLIKDKELRMFVTIVSDILNKKYVVNDEMTESFASLGLLEVIKKRNEIGGNELSFKLTTFGKEVYDKIIFDGL